MTETIASHRGSLFIQIAFKQLKFLSRGECTSCPIRIRTREAYLPRAQHFARTIEQGHCSTMRQNLSQFANQHKYALTRPLMTGILYILLRGEYRSAMGNHGRQWDNLESSTTRPTIETTLKWGFFNRMLWYTNLLHVGGGLCLQAFSRRTVNLTSKGTVPKYTLYTKYSIGKYVRTYICNTN
jgi:hypothetical protein